MWNNLFNEMTQVQKCKCTLSYEDFLKNSTGMYDKDQMWGKCDLLVCVWTIPNRTQWK